MQPNQPGEVITPRTDSAPTGQATASPQAPLQSAPVVVSTTLNPSNQAPEQPAAEAVAVQPQAQSEAVSPYPDPSASNDAQNGQLPEEVSWTASEYIAHHKSVGWYILLGLITLAAATGVFFVTSKDVFSAVVIVLAGAIFGVYAARRPQVQEYRISPEGVYVGQKRYSFDDIKSFAVVDEGAVSSIAFISLKRFMPTVSVYYDPADEEKILTTLSLYLPIEERRHDPIDRLMQRIRF